MNLINFHTYQKNKEYITENIIYFCGQGLCNSYWITPMGNGHNKYIFIVAVNEKEYKVTIEEKHIIEWVIGAQYDENDNVKPIETVKFKALGRLENNGQYQYIELYVDNCDDFTNLNNTLKIIDIAIKNDYPEIPMINITNENQYCDEIMIPRQELYYDALKNRIDMENTIKVQYEDLFNENEWNKTFYFVIDGFDSIIPFEIIKMKKFNVNTCEINDGNDILEALIHYRGSKFNITNIKLFHNPENENSEEQDEYDILLNMRIDYHEFDKRYTKELFEYCFIVRF